MFHFVHLYQSTCPWILSTTRSRKKQWVNNLLIVKIFQTINFVLIRTTIKDQFQIFLFYRYSTLWHHSIKFSYYLFIAQTSNSMWWRTLAHAFSQSDHAFTEWCISHIFLQEAQHSLTLLTSFLVIFLETWDSCRQVIIALHVIKQTEHVCAQHWRWSSTTSIWFIVELTTARHVSIQWFNASTAWWWEDDIFLSFYLLLYYQE
jgi:hypothetical protein